jgi:hypothetical protein
MNQPFRLAPSGKPSDYITYAIRATTDVAVVSACKDVGCRHWLHGWQTSVDETTDLGKSQAAYIRQKSGRTFAEQRTGAGLTVFRFEAFQRCFSEHRTKPDRFIRRDGDFRGNPTGNVVHHARAQDWIEDFQEHEGSLADERQKG